MKLKKIFKSMIIAVAFMLAITAPVQSNAAATAVEKISVADPDKNAEMLARISQRVNEIQNMDKTNLTADEKRALRKELKGMYKNAAPLDQKVYLSVGAIIIIILVLILILK